MKPSAQIPHATPLQATPAPTARQRVKQLSSQLEAVFINQLFQAMRASVPQEGPTEASAGEEMFTSMLDDRLAGEAAERMQHGIGEALYRQLSRGLPADAPANPIHGDRE